MGIKPSLPFSIPIEPPRVLLNSCDVSGVNFYLVFPRITNLVNIYFSTRLLALLYVSFTNGSSVVVSYVSILSIPTTSHAFFMTNILFIVLYNPVYSLFLFTIYLNPVQLLFAACVIEYSLTFPLYRLAFSLWTFS